LHNLKKSIGEFKEARTIFKEGFQILKNSQNKEERVMLFDSWREFETEAGDEQSRSDLIKNTPKRVKKKKTCKNRNWTRCRMGRIL